MAVYRLTYDASTNGDGSLPVIVVKSAEELLMPNGDESFLDFLLRESDRRGSGMFKLEKIT